MAQLINNASLQELENMILVQACELDSKYRSWTITIDNIEHRVMMNKGNSILEVNQEIIDKFKNKSFSLIRSCIINSNIDNLHILYGYILNLETSQKIDKFEDLYNQMNDKMQLIVDLLDLQKNENKS